jgi:hypothetical protein
MYPRSGADRIAGMLSTKSIAAAALSALALTGACAQSAAADSISYIKGGDVWLSTPDGARQFQVTTTGGYKSASQSDDGTIVALKGQRIHKLDRLGNVLPTARPPSATARTTTSSRTPATSSGRTRSTSRPDGKKVAYNWHWQYWTTFGGDDRLPHAPPGRGRGGDRPHDGLGGGGHGLPDRLARLRLVRQRHARLRQQGVRRG